MNNYKYVRMRNKGAENWNVLRQVYYVPDENFLLGTKWTNRRILGWSVLLRGCLSNSLSLNRISTTRGKSSNIRSRRRITSFRVSCKCLKLSLWITYFFLSLTQFTQLNYNNQLTYPQTILITRKYSYLPICVWNNIALKSYQLLCTEKYKTKSLSNFFHYSEYYPNRKPKNTY